VGLTSGDKMKAKITNNTSGPKGFYVGAKQVTVMPNKSVEGDYEDGLLQSLKDTGFDIEHEGKLKIADAKPAKGDTKAIIDAAKAEAEKILADAKAEAEKVLAETKAEAEKIIGDASSTADKVLADAKAASDKIIAEAEELTKADK